MQKSEFSSQAQRHISPHTSNHGILLPDASVNDSVNGSA